jgi:hypothetical protein
VRFFLSRATCSLAVEAAAAEEVVVERVLEAAEPRQAVRPL